MASTDATPFPMKNVAYRVTFPILDADGDLVTGATSPDSEVSKDGGAFADCTNEATEIATSSGMYYLDLTSTEMNADTVAIIVKSGNGKTTPIVLYPQEAGDINVDVTYWNGTAVATPTTGGVPEVDITHIAGAAVSTTTAQLGVNVVQISTDATAADNAELFFDGTGYAGGTTKLGVDVVAISGDSTAADNAEAMFDGAGYAGGTIKLGVDAVAISGDTTAANNAESFFDGTGYAGTNNVIPTVTAVTTVNGLAAGVITAAAIATGAIDADALAADAVDEILDEVVEGALTVREILRIILAVTAGQSTGGGTSTITFRDVADAKARVSATIDGSRNRTAVTLDGS